MGSLNTTPRTWVASEIVDETMLNEEIRDALTELQDEWVAYTPTWTASTTNPTIGNGTLTGRYHRVGKTIDVAILLTWGSTTTVGSGNYAFALPVAARSSSGSMLQVFGFISGATPNYWLGCTSQNLGSTTGNLVYPSTGTIGDWNTLTHSAPGGFASGDTLRISGRYEAA